MKNTKVYFLAYFLVAFYNCNYSQEKDSIIVKVFIDEKLTDVSQWVYWTSLSEYGTAILDSIYLEKNQTQFTFKKSFEDKNYEFNSNLIFEKQGPANALLFLKTGDNISVYIDENTHELFPYTEGTVMNTEWYNHKKKLYRVQDSIFEYNDSLVFATNKTDSVEFIKKIEELQEYIRRGRFLDVLRHSESARFVTLELLVMKWKMIFSEKEIDSLAKIAKSRFPNYKRLQIFPEEIQYPLESDKSKRTAKRLMEMFSKRIENGKPTQQLSETFQDSLNTIKSYKVGDIVKDIHIKGLDGKDVNLKSIKTEYVLIDFWASWCIPCRKETPYLRNTVEAYPEKLSVFAISFCNSEEEWKETIEKDNSGMFIHGYSGNFNSSETSIIFKAQFGIKAIPANFLLDKDRRIIATDLRGDELINKMKELAVK